MTDYGPSIAEQFPCGCLITTGIDCRERTIIFANPYLHQILGFAPDSLINQPLSALMTPASCIIFDSYMLPMLMHDGRCEEILLEFITSSGRRIPVVVNMTISNGNEKLIYWSLFNATQRSKLYQELVEARRLLEEKSAMLQELSVTDELTGLVNRRELMRRANILVAEAKRTETGIAILIIDLDHFKRINDSHGHAGGDLILEKLGRLLLKQGRVSDIVARYGGEEFIFVLPDANEDCARHVAARLHEIVKQVRIGDKHLTISIGISLSGSNKTLSYETLFEQADKALYQAKASGRNRTVVFGA